MRICKLLIDETPFEIWPLKVLPNVALKFIYLDIPQIKTVLQNNLVQPILKN